jgi:hypothetical protein
VKRDANRARNEKLWHINREGRSRVPLMERRGSGGRIPSIKIESLNKDEEEGEVTPSPLSPPCVTLPLFSDERCAFVDGTDSPTQDFASPVELIGHHDCHDLDKRVILIESQGTEPPPKKAHFGALMRVSSWYACGAACLLRGFCSSYICS